MRKPLEARSQPVELQGYDAGLTLLAQRYFARRFRPLFSISLLLSATAISEAPAAGFLANVTSTLGMTSSSPAFDPKKATPWIDQIDAQRKPITPFVPDEKMLKPYAKASLGPRIAYSVVNGINFVTAPEAQALCQKIVDEMLGVWKGGPKPKVHVSITADASYGAHAMPTGDIHVNIGTFSKDFTKGVASEDELALVLGHELAHLLLPHLTNKREFLGMVDALSTAASLGMTAAMFKDSQVAGQSIQVNADQELMAQMLVGGLATTMLIGDIVTPSWGSADEGEADMLGADLARRAHYAVGDNEIRQFVQKHAESEAVRTERMKRLQAISTVVADDGKPKIETNNTDLDKLLNNGLMGISALVVDGVFGQIAKLTVDHPDRQIREDALADYVFNTTPKGSSGDSIDRKTKGLNSVKNEKLTKVVESAATTSQVSSLLLASLASGPSGNVQQAAPAPLPVAVPMTTTKGQPASKDDRSEKIVKAGTSTDTSAQAAKQTAIPSACGNETIIKLANPSAVSGTEQLTIDKGFPVEEIPHAWSIRGYWAKVSPGCGPHAIEDWSYTGYLDHAGIDAFRNLTEALAGTAEASILPPLYDRYRYRLGTDQDFPDLAVAAAIVKQDIATAEVKAAECLKFRQKSRYPYCVRFLGYDPTAKDVVAKTPEGKKAFLSASASGISNSITDIPFKNLFGP
jgi:Zn-dependent protease with chaperone function